MGMIACLQVVDDLRIEQLLSKDADDLFAEIEEMQEDNDSVLDIDKLWDGLHFLLTGVSACEPIEGNLISEAIVGTRKFIEDEDTDHIAYIPYERVRAIAKELNDIDINDVVNISLGYLNSGDPKIKDTANDYLYAYAGANEDEIKGYLATELYNRFIQVCASNLLTDF